MREFEDLLGIWVYDREIELKFVNEWGSSYVRVYSDSLERFDECPHDRQIAIIMGVMLCPDFFESFKSV